MRPNSIVLKIGGIFSSHRYIRETVPQFVSDNLANFMRKASKEKIVHLVTRLRENSRLDLQAGAKDAPQIAEKLEGANLYKAMAAYLNWKRDKEPMRQNSSPGIQSLVTYAYDNGLLKSHVYDDAVIALRNWSSRKHPTSNYTISEESAEAQK